MIVKDVCLGNKDNKGQELFLAIHIRFKRTTYNIMNGDAIANDNERTNDW